MDTGPARDTVRTRETTAAGYPRGDLRVSDADRDRAISELSEHFQAGRLTADEFEERSGAALQARTGSDVAKLFSDLPGYPAPAQGTAVDPGGFAPRPAGYASVPRIVFAAPVIAVSVIAALASGHHGGHALAVLPVLAVLLIIGMARRIGRGCGHYRGHL